MKIEDKRKTTKKLKFKDLNIGDVFTPNDIDEIYYRKIDDLFIFDGSYVNAMDLYNCELITIPIETPVKFVKAKLVIED